MHLKSLTHAVAAALATVLLVPAAQAEHFDTDCGDLRGYQENAAWPTAGGCSTRLGLAGVSGARTADVNWKLELGDGISGPVIAADGTQYIGVGTTLRAIAENGSAKWSVNLGGKVEASAAIGHAGVVYAVTKAGTLSARNPASGAMLWRYDGASGVGVDAELTIDGRGTIYLVDKQGTVHAVAGDGKARWRQSLGNVNRSSMTMSRDGLTLYIGSNDKVEAGTAVSNGNGNGKANGNSNGKPSYGLHALKASNGTVRWFSALGNEKVTAPAIGIDGTIYVGSEKGRLIALHGFDGSFKWSVDDKSCSCGNWKKIVESPAIAPDGSILFSTYDGILVQVSRAGEVEWALDLGKRLSGSPVLDEEGVAYVATRFGAVYAIDLTGAVVWTLNTNSQIYAGLAIGGQGTIYVGTKFGQYYSVGRGEQRRPISTMPVQPLVPAPDEEGNPFDPRVSYCAALPLPPSSSERGTTASDFTHYGIQVGRPGLNVSYDPSNEEFTVSVAGSVSDLACSPRLCDIDNNPLPEALSNQLLNFDSADAAAWAALPAYVKQPCEVLSTGPCRLPDFAQANYAAPCGDNQPACAPNYECAMVCPAGADGKPQTDCETRSPYCVALTDNPLCEGNEDLVEGELCLAVQECTRAEDIVTREEATVGCSTTVDGPRGSCEELGAAQIAALKEPPTTHGTPSQPEDLEAIGLLNIEQEGAFCKVKDRDIADKSNTGGSPSAAGGNGKKWGISQDAGFESGYDMKAGPLGVPLPFVNGGAHFNLEGKVWGKNIPIVNLTASAIADLTQSRMESVGEFTLFGQQIAAVSAGANLDQGLEAGGAFTSPKAALDDVKAKAREYESNARARLAQMTRAYQRVFYAADGSELPPEARVISQKLCKKILGPAQPLIGKGAQYLVDHFPMEYERIGDSVRKIGTPSPITVHPICDAPLTATTANVVMNELVRRYQDSASGLAEDVRSAYDPAQPDSPWAKFEDALALQYEQLKADGQGTKPFYDPANPKPVYASSVHIPGIEPEFSLAAASAVFPIGPLALVLDVQATGYWGIDGKVDYGFETALHQPNPAANAKLVRLFASASVEPYAGIKLDLYVGVGFDFGIGGASVGINGDLTLVEVRVPVGGQTELYVTQSDLSGTAPAPWPDSLAGLVTSPEPLLSPKRFVLGTSTGLRAGMTVTALSGDLNLALRVRLLFVKKTWKKKIAELKGFKKEYSWVWSKDSPLGEVKVPSPDLQYVASIQWPDVAEFGVDTFGHLPAAIVGLGDLTANSVEELSSTLAANYLYFEEGRYLPNFSASNQQLPEPFDRWQSSYGAGSVAVAAQNELADKTNMSGVCVEPVIIH